MPGFNVFQEDDDVNFSFQEWKKKWKKDYPIPDEENARFETFKENFRAERVNPSKEPLWKVLNERADRPIQEHYGYIRLDYSAISDSDEDLPDARDAPLLYYIPVKQEDGTMRCQVFYPDEAVAIHQAMFQEREALKNQTTVPPVKRSSDDKDDTKEEDQDGAVKRQKIGCDGQNVAVTVENEES